MFSDIKDLAELAAEMRMQYETCREVYMWACEYLGCIPVTPYLRSMDSEVCDLDSYGIGAKGSKAMAVSLIINTHITTLNLAHNAIGPKGTSNIVYMLSENCFITTLILGKKQNNLIKKFVYFDKNADIAPVATPRQAIDKIKKYHPLRRPLFQVSNEKSLP